MARNTPEHPGLCCQMEHHDSVENRRPMGKIGVKRLRLDLSFSPFAICILKPLHIRGQAAVYSERNLDVCGVAYYSDTRGLGSGTKNIQKRGAPHYLDANFGHAGMARYSATKQEIGPFIGRGLTGFFLQMSSCTDSPSFFWVG